MGRPRMYARSERRGRRLAGRRTKGNVTGYGGRTLRSRGMKDRARETERRREERYRTAAERERGMERVAEEGRKVYQVARGSDAGVREDRRGAGVCGRWRGRIVRRWVDSRG